jgi:pyridoxine 5-phosphate synthase
MLRGDAGADVQFERLRAGAVHGAALGLEVHAGHGLDYSTGEQISALPQIVELNIGHFLVGEAVFAGLDRVIEKMRAAVERGRAARTLA